MNQPRRLLIAALVSTSLLAVLAIAGVFFVKRILTDDRPNLSAAAVIGVWKGGDGCTLILSEDRTFQMSNIPVSFLGPATSPNTSIIAVGSGEWSLRAAANDPTDRKTQVSLLFRELDGYPTPYSSNLRSSFAEDGIALFWFVGDPDLGRRFDLEKI
ncbi:hypothetical protein E1193_04915 [Micromonospora sp. KC606]|uniref:hypothetical protein n=1 Tax=Micromonospora sp. KC606 TaxID=2530379 RepID=UPI0010505A7F|nr:hypothetical protein [Micromonospora sp. KC606]TDC84667.1 hypothetical protein E1193_04915 [Micromonospora sp. KC606]